jgi:serine/threonine-protein kinase HipA
VAFNWIIAGTDAHAKNCSVLPAGGGQVRPSPLYDLASALPYPGPHPERLNLAMKIGTEYRLRRIGRAEWAGAATRLRRDEPGLNDCVLELTHLIIDAVDDVRDELRDEGVVHPIVERLADSVRHNAETCAGRFEGRGDRHPERAGGDAPQR